jgi:protein-L-isoaspartate O-methyltransferase
VLLAPVGGAEAQTMVRITRHEGRTHEQWLLECRFVKLLGQFGWKE